MINAAILPNRPLCHLIEQLEVNEALLWKGDLVAAKFNQEQFTHLMKNEDLEELSGPTLKAPNFHISVRWPTCFASE